LKNKLAALAAAAACALAPAAHAVDLKAGDWDLSAGGFGGIVFF
jgi:hypothetical protein